MPGAAGPNLGLIYGYAAGEAGWGVGGFNPDMAALDALVHLAVLAQQDAPPGSPNAGDRYIVGTGSGAWAGHDDDVARWNGTGWEFFAPREGWQAWQEADGRLWLYASGSWAVTPASAFAWVSDTLSGASGQEDVISFDVTDANANAGVDLSPLRVFDTGVTLFEVNQWGGVGVGQAAPTDLSGLNVARKIALSGLDSQALSIDRTTAGTCRIDWSTSGVLRWGMLATGAEGGANAGSDLLFVRFNDAGGVLGTALTLRRSDGVATFGALPVIPTTTPTLATQAVSRSHLDARLPLLNMTATTDPGVGDDTAAGYSIGSIWFNRTGQLIWFCLDATGGAAVWLPFIARAAVGALLRPAIDSTLWDGLRATSVTGGTLVANTEYGGLWTCPQTGYWDQMGLRITTGAAGNLKLGIHAIDPTNRFGTVLGETNTDISTASAGPVSAALITPAYLIAGTSYWLTAVTDAAPTMLCFNPSAPQGGGFSWQSGSPSVGKWADSAGNYTSVKSPLTYVTGSAFLVPAASPASFGAGAPGCPIIGIRKA